jgi:hypothetical protein
MAQMERDQGGTILGEYRAFKAISAGVPFGATMPYHWLASSPAVTIARSLSDTFAGIAPSGVALFIVAQLAGMVIAVAVGRWLWRA